MNARAKSNPFRTPALVLLTALAAVLVPHDGDIHTGRAAAQATMTATLNPSADATVRVLVPFGNDGTSTIMSVSSASIAGLERSLVSFDQGAIAAAVGTNVLVSATVELTVNGIATNWLGGRIGIHQMTKAWTEGGATWSCANDTFTGLVGDLFNNCTTANRWGMDWLSWYPVPYEATPTDYANLVSTSGDTVAFDVTSDVTSFLAGESNHGWALIGTQDLISGSWVQFGSREHATRKPRLVLTYAPPPPPPVPEADQILVSVPATADTFVSELFPDWAREGSTRLKANSDEALFTKRALVQFSDASINSRSAAAGVNADYELESARLVMTVKDRWSLPNLGHSIDVHKMVVPWTPATATWRCANDTNTANLSADCAGANAWAMAAPVATNRPYAPAATDTQMAVTNYGGEMSFDVTIDVAPILDGTVPNYGWLVDKPDQPWLGFISFFSIEGGIPPRLELSYRRRPVLDIGEVCDADSAEADRDARDARCRPGLLCGHANGAGFSEPAEAGVCWPASCENNIKDPAETDVDCGGDCGSCSGACTESFCRLGETVLPTPTATLSFSSGTFTRATSATYQVSARELEHARRDRLRYEDRGDGHGRVALFEGASTNVLRWSESLAELPWTASSASTSPMLLTFGEAAPDGNEPVPTLLAEASSDFSPVQFSAGPGGVGVLTSWQRLSPFSLAPVGGTRLHVNSTNNSTVYGRQESVIDHGWTRQELATANAPSGANVFFAHHASFPVAGLRQLPAVDFEVWGMQWEAGRFPTSYIRTDAATYTRAADTLTFTSAQVPAWMRTGMWQVDVYPEFASSEMATARQYMLLSFGGANDGVLLIDGKVRVRVGGSNRLDRAVSWDRNDKLTITVNAAGSAITISGANSGNGTVAVAAFSFPTAALRIGGTFGATGTEAFARISEPRRVTAVTQACVPDSHACTVDCPCDSGEGGCFTDFECVAGLECLPNAGEQFGYPASFGVCADPDCTDTSTRASLCGTPRSPCGLCDTTTICTADCEHKSCGDNGCGGSCGDRCGNGEGGATSSLDCEAGLVLGVAMGAQFDLPADMNVCVDPICNRLRRDQVPCGSLSDLCGECPICVPQCDGRVCGDDGCGGSCGTCAVGGCADGGYCVAIAGGPIAHPTPVGTDLSNAPVGTLPGAFAVNHAGEATYSLPLAVPPGRGGVQPNLSLSYNSNRDNGYLGLGWAMEGFSSISRCARTVGIDGYAEAPQFLPSDALCLDGNRLVAFAGLVDRTQSPSATISFRLESDQFMLIKGYYDVDPSTDILTGPLFFRAWTKDGRVIDYGTSQDGNAIVYGVDRNGQPQVATWLLNQIADRTNNAMNVQYVHRTNGMSSAFDDAGRAVEFYPHSITYGPAEAPIAVRFVYDFDIAGSIPRADTRSAWRFGANVQVNHLLRNVNVELDGALFRSYVINYDDQQATGAPYLLETVQQCDQDGVCMPATVFEYESGVDAQDPSMEELEDPVVPGSDITALVPPGADYGTHDLVGQPLDLNGDGIDDMLYQVTSYYNAEDAPDQQMDFVALMSNGTVGGASHEYVHTGITSDFIWIWSEGLFGWSEDSETQIATVQGGMLGTLDYNNDGRQDVLTATWHRDSDISTYRVLSYNGQSFDFIDTGIHYDYQRPGLAFVADANGDGYHDLIRCLPDPNVRTGDLQTFSALGNEWYIHYNDEGDGFRRSTTVTLDTDAPCTADSQALDVNGDGRDEMLIKLRAADPSLVSAPATAPSVVMYIDRENNVAFHDSNAMLGDYAGHYNAGSRSKLIDINGDGLNDVLGWSILGYESATMSISISINRGDGRFDVTQHGLDFGASNADQVRALGMNRSRAVDVNRDGKQDLIASTLAPGTYDTFFSNGTGFEPGRELGLFGALVRDYDGDGYKEPGYRIGGSPLPKLRMVTDGFGAVTTALYGSLTDPEIHTSLLYDANGDTDCEYPFLCRRHTGWVVRSHALNEGDQAKQVGWTHRYEGARTAAERRGFLGFRMRTVVEEPRFEDAVSTTSYVYDNETRNDIGGFPFAFIPFRKTQVTNLSDAQYVVTESSEYESTYPFRGTAYGFEIGTDVAVPMVTTRDRYTISDRGVIFLSREREEIEEYDALYGNALEKETSLAEGETRIVTRQYKHLEDPAFVEAWLIGLPSVIEDRYVYEGKDEIAKRSDFSYYDTGLLMMQLDETGLIQSFTYNEHGGLETQGAGGFDDGVRQRTIVWDDLDEYPIAETNVLELETTMQYDRRFGQLLWTQDPSGMVTTTGYDNFGRIRAHFMPSGASISTSYHPGPVAYESPMVVVRQEGTGARSELMLDRGGRLSSRRSWDFKGKDLRQDTSYDNRGRVTRKNLPTAQGTAQVLAKTFEYDNLDRVVVAQTTEGTNRFCYQDNVACVEDGRSMVRCAVRDSRGRVALSTEPVQATCEMGFELWPFVPSISYTYQGYDILHEVTDQGGNVTTVTVDSSGRKIASDSPDRGEEEFEYNVFGDVKTYTNGAGKSSTYEFDEIGRLERRRDWRIAPNAGIADDTTWEWDGGDTLEAGELRGMITSMTSPDDVVTDYRYDGRGLLHEKIMRIDGQEYKTTRTWDSLGRARSVAYPQVDGADPFVIQYAYADPSTNSGALTQVFNTGAAYNNEVYWSATDTDVHGRLTHETMGNGSERARSWYTTGRLHTLRTVSASAVELQDFEFLYDQSGNLELQIDGVQGRTDTFVYDRMNRLRAENTVHPRTYEYDLLGNLVQDGFEYEENEPHAVSATPGFEYDYDRAGRRTHKLRPDGSGQRIEYTSFGLPTIVRALAPGGATAATTRFEYDAMGARVRKITEIGERVYAGDFEIQTFEDGSPSQQIFSVSNGLEVVAQVKVTAGEQPSTAYLHPSRMGTPGVVEEGSEITEVEQDAFGLPVTSAGWSAPTTLGITGQQMDGDLELIDMKGRIYDPRARQFLTPDPIIGAPFSPLDLHPYGYAWGNPLRYSDPSGLQEEDLSVDTFDGPKCVDACTMEDAAVDSDLSGSQREEEDFGSTIEVDTFTSPLGADGFGDDPFESSFDDSPGGPDWAEGQLRNTAWVTVGAGVGVGTGILLAKGAAVLAATTAGPVILVGLGAYAVYKGIEAYDYDAIAEWGSKFYGNELTVSELLTGGFVLGSTATGLRGIRYTGGAAAKGTFQAGSDLVREAARQEVAKGVPHLLGFLSNAERSAYLANPAKGSRFLGQAVHRATARALEASHPGRFNYFTRGADFIDNLTGEVIELTTPAQVAAHAARDAFTEIVTYVLP